MTTFLYAALIVMPVLSISFALYTAFSAVKKSGKKEED
jgi:hypothetical protein